MTPTAERVPGESPGMARADAVGRGRRTLMGGYASKCTPHPMVTSPEIRGTTACCISSESSRFYIHPFREGNGRTQRVFWDRVSRDAGYTLHWREVSGRVNDDASRTASEARDLGPLQAMFDHIAVPLERDRDGRSARADRLAIRRHYGEDRDAELGFDR